MESILITGANGFIGSNLCRYFIDHGYRVHALVRPTSDLHFIEGLPVSLVRGDLADGKPIALPEDIDFVIHAASAVGDFATMETAVRNTFDTTVSLVRFLRSRGARLKRFIYISSALVLGYGSLNISESRPGRSVRFLAYTRAKEMAESFLFEEYRERGLPVVILRPSDVFGPHDRTIAAKLLPGIEKGVPPIVGRGDRLLGFCFVDNLALACLLACGINGRDGKAYTVTNGQEISWKRLFTAILARLGRRQRVYVPVAPVYLLAFFLQLLHVFLPSFEPPLSYYRVRRITTHTDYDISDTLRELGYCPDQDFDAQIDSVVDWYTREKESGYLAKLGRR